jgi:N-acetylmuramoyl-L-alanine amidase
MLNQALPRRIALTCGVAAAVLLRFGHAGATQAQFQGRGSPRRAKPKSTTPELPLVMLDPGHGGKDPGAIGATGTYEKHVALAAAEELQRALLKSGRYRVELTRRQDVFIHLDDRVSYAQERKATLFVSMHADALTDPAVRGASVYTLASTASDAQSAALARRENSADRFAGTYVQGVSPEVAKILASLVRQETRIASTRLSRSLVSELDRAILMLPNPARHAGFVVLKAPDIPSVLVEMGFMSNPRDEAALQRPEHRAKVVAAMHRSVDAYFASLDRGLVTSS